MHTKRATEIFRGLFKAVLFDYYNVETTTLMEIMKKKHMVDSIYVATKDGTLICSTNDNSREQILDEIAIFNYINAEVAAPEALFIKSDHWLMFFPHGGKIYSVCAPVALTQSELRALAKEIEEHLLGVNSK